MHSWVPWQESTISSPPPTGVLFVYCLCTVCVLFVYCLCTNCVLFVYCLCTVCVLFVYCLCTVCVLFVYCLCTVCVLFVYYRRSWTWNICGSAALWPTRLTGQPGPPIRPTGTPPGPSRRPVDPAPCKTWTGPLATQETGPRRGPGPPVLRTSWRRTGCWTGRGVVHGPMVGEEERREEEEWREEGRRTERIWV